MKVIVLAGGFATRLWPITESRAKPLLLVDGKSILYHLLTPVLASDSFVPEDVYLCTNQKFLKDFEHELTKNGWQDVHVFCEDAYQDGEKLGALGAIAAVIAAHDIEDDLLILAGDNIITDFDPTRMQVSPDSAKLTIRQVADLYAAQKFGVVEVDEAARVIGFEEKPDKPKSTLVSAGFLSLGKNLLPILTGFAAKEPDALGGIFPELLAQRKKVEAYETKGDWFDVGSFETYLEAHKTLQAVDHKFATDATSDDNQLAGKTFFGHKTVVENSTVVDSLIYPNCIIKNCQISNCVIDENCHLENLDLSYKVIRQNTHLVG